MDYKETNKLIAKFLGAKKTDVSGLQSAIWYPINGKSVYEHKLKFHSSWNWLMRVVEKIENTRTIENDGYYDLTIFSDAVIVTKELNREDIIIINKSEVIGSLNHECILFEDKITSVYQACILFIRWYNKNK